MCSLPCFFVRIVFSTAPILFTVYKWPMKHSLRQTANLPNTAPILFTVYKWPMKHSSRQTANLPNQSLFVPAVYLTRKLTFTPRLSGTAGRSVQVILVVFESLTTMPVFGHAAAPCNSCYYVAALYIEILLYETRGSVKRLESVGI